MARYIFRLDDIHPEMSQANFNRCMDIFLQKGIKPLLGIIPENTDKSLSTDPFDTGFWQKIRELTDLDKIDVAQHGFRHSFATRERGLLGKCYGFKNGSEFAGLNYADQLAKITEGKNILETHGIQTDIFMAPNHSFDKNTIKALLKNGFKAITDGIGLYPHNHDGITFIPQILWRPRRFPIGIVTICLHPATMKESDFVRLTKFVSKNHGYISIKDALLCKNNIIKNYFNLCFRFFYIVSRFIKKIVYSK